MGVELSEIVVKYGRAWDADAPEGLVEEVFAVDVVDHNPSTGQGEGREGLKEVMRRYQAAFPDLRVTHDEVILAGDRAVVRWHATGTHDGDDLGVPATHRTVHLTGIDIIRIADGKIVERWGESDGHKRRQQIAPL